jgi:DNA topoisomerase-1
MHDAIAVTAGDCTSTFDGNRVRAHEQRGRMVVVVKPDNTVLVHDADGYQPVAWLTRADSVTVDGDRIEARDGDQHLRVEVHEEFGSGRYPASEAGKPVGTCPSCASALVRVTDGVTCISCNVRYGLPGDATVLEERCDCGLPKMEIERGHEFQVCLDRDCESMDAAVKRAFDREWDCPNCEGDLRILRRGGLLAGCERYPDCDTGFAFPAGTVTGTCSCGLPLFETTGGTRCLDATCEWPQVAEESASAPGP